MSNDNKVTVIIPTHNSERYIEECVRSAMNQTYGNLEIICVDSSSDNTINILKKLQTEDTRIQIIEDANGSYGHKLNVGIQRAKGDYIAILESDDYILPDMYRFMLDGMADDVDYIKVATKNFKDVNDRRVFFAEELGVKEDDYDRAIDLEKERHLAFRYLPRIWTALYRRKFLLENEIFANETPGASYQDTSFTYAVALLAKNCIYKKGAFHCYRNDNMNSSVKSSGKVFCVCDEFKYLEKLLKKQNAYNAEVQQFLLHYKLNNYSWNIKRLDANAVKAFRDGIQEEMKDYTDDVIAALSENERNMLALLTNEVALKEHDKELERVVAYWNHMIQIIKEKSCVLIGAGIIGKKILQLQEWLDIHSIQAIGDNNFAQIKDDLKGYGIQSIEDVVSRCPEEYYLIANKKNYLEIMDQLASLGVSREQMIGINESPNMFILFSECIKANS